MHVFDGNDAAQDVLWPLNAVVVEVKIAKA